MAPRLLPPPDLRPRVQQYSERTEGLHLSTITQDLLIGLDPERYGEQDDDSSKWMNFLAGILFERIIEAAWVDNEFRTGGRPELIRPGEVARDRIIGTPDAYDTALGRPEEYKCTKKTCRVDITDRRFWHYWVQLKAYAYMMRCNSGVLWVLFVNGNYSRDDKDPDSGYVIRGWEDTWTDLQLQENFTMLTNHARRRGWLK